MDNIDLEPNADGTFSVEPKGWHPKKIKPWHEMLMDFILLNPTANNIEIGEHFGLHQQTIMLVRGSDLFKMAFDERRKSFEEKVDGTALERLSGKIAGVAERALDVLDDKIQEERKSLGIEAVRETADMALKALGYGTKPSGNSNAQGNTYNIFVDKDTLAESRRLMQERRLPQLEAPKVVNGE